MASPASVAVKASPRGLVALGHGSVASCPAHGSPSRPLVGLVAGACPVPGATAPVEVGSLGGSRPLAGPLAPSMHGCALAAQGELRPARLTDGPEGATSACPSARSAGSTTARMGVGRSPISCSSLPRRAMAYSTSHCAMAATARAG